MAYASEDGSIVPRALRTGDTIAFISPSARVNEIISAPLTRAKACLEAHGFKVKIIFHPIESLPFAQQVKERCQEVHDAFSDSDIKAIICTIGGDHVNELLQHLNYDLIRMNPKIFCGYSDITVLHHALLTHAGLRTFYGPAAITELGDHPAPLDFTLNHLLRVLQQEPDKPLGSFPRSPVYAPELAELLTDTYRPRQLDPAPGWTWLRSGKATGRLFGGCVPSVLRLTGTPYWPDYTGRILLLETSMGDDFNDPLPVGNVHAMMADLGNVGMWRMISGLVFGRCYKYDEEMRKEFAKMVLEQCSIDGREFPILIDVDFGHTDPILTIPLDALANLDSERQVFEVLEPAVTSGEKRV